MAVAFEWVDGRRYRRVRIGDRVALIPDLIWIEDVTSVDDSFHVKAGVVEELMAQVQEEVLV